jgi:phage head maturation protease
MRIAAKIRRGDVSGSSFRFDMSPDEETWERDKPGDLPLRILKRIRLLNVGPVAFPALRTRRPGQRF